MKAIESVEKTLACNHSNVVQFTTKKKPTRVQHNFLKVIVIYPWTEICFLEKIRGLIRLSNIEQENLWDWRWSFLDNVYQACIIFLIK